MDNAKGKRAGTRSYLRCLVVATLMVGLFLLSPGTAAFALAEAPGDLLDAGTIRDFESSVVDLAAATDHILDAWPTASFKVVDLSLELGFEVEDIVGWVSSHIGWVPYNGSLRGPDDVLQDRRGNSLDVSRLTAELLENAGYEVRLVHGELHPDAARSVLPDVIDHTRAVLSKPIERQPDAGTGAEFANSLGVSLADVEAAYGKASQAADDVAVELQQLAAAQARVIGDATFQGRSDATVTDAAVATLADHWWLEYDDGGGWRAVDPILGDAGPDMAANRGGEFAPEEIPDEVNQLVTLRVVAEQWSDRGLQEHVALEHTFLPRDLVEKSLTLTFSPLDFMLGGPAEMSDQDAMRYVAEKEDEWLPVLSAGDDVMWQASIRTDGTVNPNPNLTTAASKTSKAASALGGLGAKPGGRSELSAVRLEYVVEIPGERPQVVRRDLVDVVGEGRRLSPDRGPVEVDGTDVLRRGLALIGWTDILPTVSWLQQGFVQHLLLSNFTDNVEPAQGLMNDMLVDSSGSAPSASGGAADLNLLPANLYMYQLLRSTVSEHRDEVFQDRPNLVSAHTQASMRDGRIGFRQSLDVVLNDVSVLPGNPDPRRTRLAQGVLDTILEVVVGGMASGESFTTLVQPTNAASALFVSRQHGQEWKAVVEANDARLTGGYFDGDTVGRVRAALERGHVAYVPAGGPDDPRNGLAAWWDVDPETGQALGIGPRGWGQDDTGEIVLFQGGVKALLMGMAGGTARATVFCAFAGATAVTLYAIGWTVATTNFPAAGGVAAFVIVAYIGPKEVFGLVFRHCIEAMLF